MHTRIKYNTIYDTVYFISFQFLSVPLYYLFDKCNIYGQIEF